MKTKTKDVVPFNAATIEFAVASSIKKNTLPEIRDSWKAWLDSYKAADLETDQDFIDAAEFVAECKRTEDKFDEIEAKAIKGDVSKVIAEIRTMKGTTREKRLEFSNAVDTRKARIKTEAVTAAVSKVKAHISTLKYHTAATSNLYVEDDIKAAIKGKSSIVKMNEALDAVCKSLMAAATECSALFEKNRSAVTDKYAAAGETATDYELDMLVRTYGNGAAERAEIILAQKKIAKDQAEVARRKKELETPPPAPAPAPPAAAPAPIPSPAPAPAPAAAQPAPVPAAPAGVPVVAVRFGATFMTDSIEETTRLIESIGGSRVKFQVEK
jgi:hypothetical protein